MIKVLCLKNENLNFFRYQDSNINISTESYNESVDDSLILFWGKGFGTDDYEFLESELFNWKKTHKCDSYADTTLLKEICIKILTIRNKRERRENVSNDVKELQDLMKTASVDPAKANIADGAKSLDSWGLWLKDIEEYEPAEYFNDKKLFVDFDKLKKYSNKYIFRPLKNLLLGSRDFNIDEINYNEDGE